MDPGTCALLDLLLDCLEDVDTAGIVITKIIDMGRFPRAVDGIGSLIEKRERRIWRYCYGRLGLG